LQLNFDRFNNALYKEKEMADFRRCIIVLAALALLVGMATTASAQNNNNSAFQCTVNASVTPALRAEGITEKTGDLVLNCTGGTPTNLGINAQKVNIQIFLNTSITSRILSTSNNASEALLLIDEPQEAQQKVCPVPTSGANNCQVVGVGVSTTSPYLPGGTPQGGPAGAGTPYNVFQGQQAGSNSIAFLGVPIAPPGTQGGTRVFRITNIRGNANALGVSGANAPPTSLIEVISVSPSTLMPINNPQQVIGLVQKGLVVSTGGAVSFQQCFSTNVPNPPIAHPNNASSITFTEGFATAFKTRTINTTPTTAGTDVGPLNQDDPQNSANNNTESGFYNETGLNGWGSGTGGNLAAAGLADFGTRIRLTLKGVPNGVSLVALPLIVNNTGTNIDTDPAATLVMHLVTSETGGYAAASTGTITLDTSGNGAAVYEVVKQSPFAIESVTIPFTVSFTANPGANSPALGTSTFGGSFAPISTVTVATASDPIPRFADTSVASNHITINKCATHLLFPFATNQVGFDTGIAISNTSQDPYGTSTQTGTCTINFFGAGAPAAVTTAAIAAGTTYASTVMSLAPNFQGYIIADCQFQYAHGFAFVTRVGATDVAMGYLALVIPDPPRSPNGFDKAALGAGEMLGQ
jgi:hypothetical protein